MDVVSNDTTCPNTSLPITLPAGFTLSGTITCRDKPIKNAFVYAAPMEGGAPGDDLVGWGVYSVDDGSYDLPLVMISVIVIVIAIPASYYLYGKRNIAAAA